MNKRVVIILVLTALLVGGIVSLAHAHERNDGGYFTIVDEQNNPVYYTGRKVQVGDECLTEKNVRYQIVRIEGDIAYAKNIGTVDLKKYSANEPYYRMPLVSRIFGYRLAEAQGTKVAIYHTHTDESYVPTDGTESIKGNGGIFKVGSAFAQGLQKNGIEAVFSEAKHDPHDDMAYERSRRTALDLIKKNQPAAIFDIHRDAVPPKVYSGTINGQQISKVQLVVGKYGPTAKQIEDFALKIKSASDSKYPGLVKGIFFAKGGDYNQDLHPRSMLLEVGAHTNDRTSAEKGVALFADVIPSVIGGGGKPGGTAAAPTPAGDPTGLGNKQTGASGATKSIGWIIGLLVVGGGAFLFLSTGSLKEAGAKIKQFTTREFASFLGPKQKKSENDKDESNDPNKT